MNTPKPRPARRSKPNLVPWEEVQVTDPGLRPWGTTEVDVTIMTDAGYATRRFLLRIRDGGALGDDPTFRQQVEALGFTVVSAPQVW